MEESLVWLRRASDAGHPEATYELARFHHYDEDGIEYGTPTTQQAVDLLIRAAELGYVEAQRDLGAYFATGEWFGPKDEGQARHWYSRAAEQGHASAQFNLATMYLNGEGGEQNIAEGIRWLTASTEQDDTDALGYLAYVYMEGAFGVPADQTKARELENRKEQIATSSACKHTGNSDFSH